MKVTATAIYTKQKLNGYGRSRKDTWLTSYSATRKAWHRILTTKEW